FRNPRRTTDLFTLPLTTLFRSQFPREGGEGDGQCPTSGTAALRHGIEHWEQVLVENGIARRVQMAIEPPTREGRVQPAVHRQRRSEEHTSELQSLTNLVCRLLL